MLTNESESEFVYFLEDSVPKISVGPGQGRELSVKKGSNVTFTCNVSTVVKGDVQSINITWNFKTLSDLGDNVPKNSKIVLSISGGQASSQLSLTDVSVANAGVYYCSAILIFKAVPGHVSQKTPVKMYKNSIEIEKGEMRFYPISGHCLLFILLENTQKNPNVFLCFQRVTWPDMG